jgi:predicted transcriptional regulator
MLELSTAKKNKINLADYNSEQDIQSRAILSDFSLFDLEVLEEILFSPLKTSVKKISRSLDCSEADLDPLLTKLARCAFLDRQADVLIVDKDRRKYFELQINRFEESFKPDMEFLQALLKQVPIHVLPIWYAIPRATNNIFESIVEKHLLTPQVYHRYLMELTFSDPILSSILRDVFTSHDLKVSSSDLIAKYNLTRADFDHYMLQLEFHFVCFVYYQREEDHWHEVVTPYHEWREYMLFLQETETASLESADQVFCQRTADFTFVEDMGVILSLSKKKPIELEMDKGADQAPLSPALTRSLAHHIGLESDSPEELRFAQNYLSRLIEKLLLIRLADRIDGKLYAMETSNHWLDLNLETRSIHLYRHPLNRLLNDALPLSLCNERTIREAEKAIKRVINKGWVYFDEFIKGVLVPLNENSVVMLKKSGKQWKYTLPQYTDDEIALIKATAFEWLFECGITTPGLHEGRDCFTVTPFGRTFFAD